MKREQGQLGGFEGLAFGVLVFVMGTLVIANAWAAIDAKVATAAAAREAARAYVESSSTHADDDAIEAARHAIEGYGRDPSRMRLTHDGGPFGRCRRVTF